MSNILTCLHHGKNVCTSVANIFMQGHEDKSCNSFVLRHPVYSQTSGMLDMMSAV